MNRIPLLVLAAMVLLAPMSHAAGPQPWGVSVKAQPKVKASTQEHAHRGYASYGMGNWMVHGGGKHDRVALLPLYDLVACFSLTNPKSALDVELGKGVHITVDKARFRKGKWDAVVHLAEHTRIEKFDKERYFLLDLVRVGVSELKKRKHKIGAVRILAEACLERPRRNRRSNRRAVEARRPRNATFTNAEDSHA